jgi:hypothetical protein
MRSLVTLLLGAWLLLAWTAVQRRPPLVSVENHSGRAVERMILEQGENKAQLGALGPADRDLLALATRREGPLVLEVRFADGEEVRFDAGWWSPSQVGAPRLVLVSADSLRVLSR